jgi:hypothetical protein
MSLQSRIERFSQMKAQFAGVADYPLIAVHRIRPDLFERLEHAICVFMSRCLPDGRLAVDEETVMAEFRRVRSIDRGLIRNCTPNGMLVPKNHTILEYNAVVAAYAAIIDSLQIGPFVSSWHVPLNVRYKDGEILEENMARHHPTEHIHSDSWAGESPASVTTILPILGDAARNCVRFYAPPPDFEESWLGPLPSYRDGAHIASRYTPLDIPFEKGYVYLADFGTLHASTRLPGAEPRVSIDTTFAMRCPSDEEAEAEIKMPTWRKEERATQQDLLEIGRRKLFFFPDSVDQQVDSEGGFKHPTTLRLVSLVET